jgi:hypothetical protein
MYLATFAGSMTGANDYEVIAARLVLNGVTVIGNGPGLSGLAVAAATGGLVTCVTSYKFAVGETLLVQVYQDNTPNVARNLDTNPVLTVNWVGLG